MDAKNKTSLAIAAGLVAAFVLGGLTFAVGVPLMRMAAGAMLMGGPAYVHADGYGPMGHDLDGMYRRGLDCEDGGYGMRGRGVMPGQRGEMRQQLPEGHPRFDDDGEGRRPFGPRGMRSGDETAAPDPEGALNTEICPECPVDTL